MPCGGIRAFAGTPYPCWVCSRPTAELFCDEWDTTLHLGCLGAFLASPEGAIVLAHGHGIDIPEGWASVPLPDAESPRAESRSTRDALAHSLRLARLALAFGRVERATKHEDGVRVETDTDHTVMLALVAGELAPPHLDRPLIVSFATVHDLLEVYSGDENTLMISAEGREAKRVREDAARERLVAELGPESWLALLVSRYEAQKEPETRFVRLVDKVLPKLTHAYNGCAAARPITDHAGFVEAHARQYARLAVEYPEFPDTLALLREAMRTSELCWRVG